MILHQRYHTCLAKWASKYVTVLYITELKSVFRNEEAKHNSETEYEEVYKKREY